MYVALFFMRPYNDTYHRRICMAPSDAPVYRLVDWHGDKLDGTFYEPELQKVVVPKGKTYRVESVLRWRNNRRGVLVKWSGAPHPSTVG